MTTNELREFMARPEYRDLARRAAQGDEAAIQRIDEIQKLYETTAREEANRRTNTPLTAQQIAERDAAEKERRARLARGQQYDFQGGIRQGPGTHGSVISPVNPIQALIDLMRGIKGPKFENPYKFDWKSNPEPFRDNK